MKKLISWNVNGLRACMGKGFSEAFRDLDADIFCLQETKLQEGQIELDLPGYEQFWNYAEKKGYSGTAVFTKEAPLSVHYGIGVEEHDKEGRVITLEYPAYYLTTVYVPNSQEELKRLEYRMRWEDDFLSYMKNLEEMKPVIYCGDLNVAHKEIDLKNPKTNRRNAGFTDEERGKFDNVVSSGLIDTKKIISVLLVLALAFALCGCGTDLRLKASLVQDGELNELLEQSSAVLSFNSDDDGAVIGLEASIPGINRGIVPFTIEKEASPSFRPGDRLFVPQLCSGLLSGQEVFPAELIRGGKVQELTLYCRGLTEDERQILADGCLMNYYARNNNG